MSGGNEKQQKATHTQDTLPVLLGPEWWSEQDQSILVTTRGQSIHRRSKTSHLSDQALSSTDPWNRGAPWRIASLISTLVNDRSSWFVTNKSLAPISSHFDMLNNRPVSPMSYQRQQSQLGHLASNHLSSLDLTLIAVSKTEAVM